MLQVGEEKLVLDIGRAALRHLDSKPFIHDIFLSMALAEVRSVNEGWNTTYQLPLILLSLIWLFFCA